MNRRIGAALLAGALALAGLGAIAWTSMRQRVIEVAPGGSVHDVVAASPNVDVIRLLPGEHDPFEVWLPVTVIANAGAIVHGPVTVRADGAVLRDLVVVGGETGVRITDADDVVLDGVSVRGADLHGIEIAPGSAHVTDCVIEGLVSPYAQGLEVRNSSGRGRTIVEGCSVSSGQEGIVSHVSRVEFTGNEVSDTSLRALVVTEMSEGIVEGNRVHDVVGSGVYCGDMSHCEIRGNTIEAVTPSEAAGPSLAGWGVVGLYHSTMRLTDNTFSATEAGAVRTALSTVQTDRFPLAHWPSGWGGLLPGLPNSTAVAAATLALTTLGALRLTRHRRAVLDGRPPPPPVTDTVVALVVASLTVQAFHMLEHTVQIWQVYVIEGEQRSGILGSAVDAEWVHFGYNSLVMLFMGWLAASVWRGRWGAAAIAGVTGASLMAATAIQAVHFTEHAAKMVQHVTTGLDPAPGLIGGRLGLVWFHFGINLAVFVGLVIGALPLIRHVTERASVSFALRRPA